MVDVSAAQHKLALHCTAGREFEESISSFLSQVGHVSKIYSVLLLFFSVSLEKSNKLSHFPAATHDRILISPGQLFHRAFLHGR